MGLITDQSCGWSAVLERFPPAAVRFARARIASKARAQSFRSPRLACLKGRFDKY